MNPNPTRCPWPAPQSPPTRSLTWPAPTSARNAIVPGSVVKSRFSDRRFKVTKADDPSLLTYKLADDPQAGEFHVYPEHVQTRPKVKAAPKPAPRPVRKLRQDPVAFKTRTPSEVWQDWRTRRRLGNKRRSIGLRITDWRTPHFTTKDKLLDFFFPMLTKASYGRSTSSHTAACRKRMGNRGVGFIRTKGCPGCKKLGQKGKGRR